MTVFADKTIGFGNTPAVSVKCEAPGDADTDTTVGFSETVTPVDDMVYVDEAVLDSPL